ncbi:MAG: DNA polymerase III subunit delta [Anaerolineae bacterium]|nr:DNA polymerase III subunit delta [Anaerolineae bacterium]
MSKPTPTFYIFHGTDSLRLEEEIKHLRTQMLESPNGELNMSEFDGEQVSVAEVLNAVTSFPFLAEKRLVIVKHMLAHITRKGAGETGKQAVARLEETLPTLPDWARLVFVESSALSDSHKIVKLARSSPTGYEKAFNAPKDSTQWLIQRAQSAYEVEIEPRAAQALASVTGDDLRRADNELVKLVSYVGGERPISEEDVAALTPYVAEANIFAMVDAIATGHGDLALTLLSRLLDDDPRDEGFGIYGMIVRQFRLLLLAKEHLLVHGSRAGLRDALGVRSEFPANKAADQSRNFTLAQLEEIYRVLQDYDLKMKTGRISPRLALELLIAGIAR